MSNTNRERPTDAIAGRGVTTRRRAIAAGLSLAGLGAAGAVVSDLVVYDYLSVSDDAVHLRDRGWKLLQCPSAQGKPTMVRWLLERIAESPPATPRDWITYLAPHALHLIVRRLEINGVVREVRPAGLNPGRTTPRHEPMDLNEPRTLGDHLRQALQGQRPLPLADVFLAGLLQITRLHCVLIPGVNDLDDLIAARTRALNEASESAAALDVLLTHTRHLIGAMPTV